MKNMNNVAWLCALAFITSTAIAIEIVQNRDGTTVTATGS